MNEKKTKELFKDIVLRFAQESHCVSYKVAAIAVRNSKIIITGINGTPPGYENCDEHFANKDIRDQEIREQHHQWSFIHELHSEQNLIAEAARTGISLNGCDIYISLEPCVHCAKLLTAIKPRAVYYVNEYDKEKGKDLLKECGILVEKI